MRQREITWQGWRASWPDVDGGRHEFTADDVVDVENEATALRCAGVADVRVRPVTRYQLAPLVEIAAWRHHKDGWSKCGARTFGTREPHAIVNRVGGGSAWHWGVTSGVEVAGRTKTKRAAIAAAEAALAWLGYRVAR
jgi:hypothetical protein